MEALCWEQIDTGWPRQAQIHPSLNFNFKVLYWDDCFTYNIAKVSIYTKEVAVVVIKITLKCVIILVFVFYTVFISYLRQVVVVVVLTINLIQFG